MFADGADWSSASMLALRGSRPPHCGGCVGGGRAERMGGGLTSSFIHTERGLMGEQIQTLISYSKVWSKLHQKQRIHWRIFELPYIDPTFSNPIQKLHSSCADIECITDNSADLKSLHLNHLNASNSSGSILHKARCSQVLLRHWLHTNGERI